MKEKDNKIPWWLWLLILIFTGFAALGIQEFMDKLFGQ